MTEPRTDRERLIRELMARRGLGTATRPAGIPRRAPGTRVPLSPTQEGMWFLDRLQPGSPAYVMSHAVRLVGPLEPAALQAALDDLVAAHEALRTRFVDRDGEVEQEVLPATDPAARCVLTVEDLGGGSAPEREAAVVAAVRDETETPFDLGHAPLLRVRLGRLDHEEHLLVVSLHHIVADERSVDIVLSGLLDGHHRHRTGTGQPPAPVAQFPDHVLWQRDRLAGGAAEQAREFWATRLKGFSGLLDLPTDRPRPATQTFAGRTHEFTVDEEVTTALDALARQTGCTRFMVLLAGLQVLLARLGGTDDVCVGSPVTLRADAAQQDIVGLLVNTLPLRTDLSGDPTLAEALTRVRNTCVESLAHADLPFERIVETARLPRDLSRNPLYQVMLVVNQDGPVGPQGDLTVRPVPLVRETSRLDLTVAVRATGTVLAGLVDYNTDLFDEVTVARFVDRFTSVLRALATEPQRRLADLDLTGPAERRDLAGWNATDRAYPTGVGLHELVRARAVADPDAPALLDVSPDAPDRPPLTYGELVDRADRLADELCRLGGRPDQPVGLVLPAGTAAVTAILAILDSGGGYLPLDPAHPPARLRALLTAAGTTVCVTDADLAGALAFATDDPDDRPYAGTLLVVDPDGHPTGPVVAPAADAVPGDGAAVDSGPGDGAAVSPLAGGAAVSTGARAAALVHPDQLAYVIHTSGSTGTPKGVMVGHRSAVNLALAFADLHRIGPGDRLLMLPPLSFDASVGDLFPALVSGAALVVHRQPAAITGPGLVELCRTHGITLVDTAAPLWARWVDDLAAAGPVDAGGLRAMMVGGESVDLDTVRRWARLTDGRVTVHNHYGPTEATVCATTYATVDATELPGLTRLPIGRPVPNVRVHVLDGDLRPVPIGLPGEVYVGGTAPARGYRDRPAETAVRFVPDPYGPPGARLYRTGDLARHRADGTLEFLGRTDRQVKIRGHRIEIGEVEAACAALPGVRRAAVVVDHAATGPRLVAYLVDDGTAPDGPAARTALRRRMPEHLIPAAFVRVADLPTNRHGKLDLAALPAADDTPDRPAHQPPATATERALAEIWAELLGVGPVGRQDNFFDLGGHSLLAAGVVTRARAALGVDVPLRALFEAADLAGLAALVDGTAPKPAGAGDLLRAEARLADDLPMPPGPPPSRVETVLFTGATGFLGAYLLADWLAHSTATLHCLVRADSPAAAVDRVRANLHGYRLWRPEYADRIVGVPGDLGAPRLGLTGAQFDALGERLDAVVHNGGVVNFLQPYPVLRPANVGGTLEVLRLATTGRPSAVHFVSTLGVFVTPSRTGTLVREGDLPDDPGGLYDGYNSSKWVADALVRAARDRGLPVSVHRPARITGDARTGVGNTDDFFSRLLKTCVQLGAVPDIDDPADLSPVDYVGAGIGHLTRTGSTGDHHYYNNRTITYAALAEALTDFGHPVELVPYPRWRAALLDRPDAALARFAPMFGPATPVRTQPDFDCTATEATLAGAGITCPAADRRLVHTYLAAFVAAGFLDDPSGRANG